MAAMAACGGASVRVAPRMALVLAVACLLSSVSATPGPADMRFRALQGEQARAGGIFDSLAGVLGLGGEVAPTPQPTRKPVIIKREAYELSPSQLTIGHGDDQARGGPAWRAPCEGRS
jgi:hypothetical protein